MAELKKNAPRGISNKLNTAEATWRGKNIRRERKWHKKQTRNKQKVYEEKRLGEHEKAMGQF